MEKVTVMLLQLVLGVEALQKVRLLTRQGWM
jgi:hypothetical protein